MIDKILVGIDGSDASQYALDYSAELAEDNNSELVVLAVVPNTPMLLSEEFANSYLPRLEEDLENSYTNMVEESVERIRSNHPELEISKMIIQGVPAEVIIEKATSEGADLIVIGNRGTGGVVNWFLGSTSRKVVESCTVPVLVVKNREFCEIN
jgi:nucleotide-binding universal stress UspA family protein